MSKKIEIDKDWLYQKYVVENLTCTEISKLLNISKETVRNRLKEYGFYQPGKPQDSYKNRKFSLETEKEIVDLYVNKGSGTMELARQFKTSKTLIRKILLRHNVTLRRASPWKNKYNIHFFDTYTKESCYWAGFIAADGNVFQNNLLSIHLQLSDLEHLKKFAKAIDYKGEIPLQPTSCRIALRGEWFPKMLKDNFNITPRKTSSINFPTNYKDIPEEFFLDYLRGYMDGDGSISKENAYPIIKITSGSSDFLESWSNYFYDKNIRVKNSIRNNTGKPVIDGYSISYTCSNAIKILDLLYLNSTEETRLTRKYNRYLFHKNNYSINKNDN